MNLDDVVICVLIICVKFLDDCSDPTKCACQQLTFDEHARL